MIKFGTSGFRGIIGDNWTKENIQKIGFAFRQMIKTAGENCMVAVGYDNRFMGKQSAEWFCEAACCESVKAILYSVPVPSPLLAFKANCVDYGVVITASHNPYFYNGIKIMLKGGKEADDSFTAKITKNIENPKKFNDMPMNDLVSKGYVTLTNDVGDYVDRITSLINAEKIKESDIKILFNPMHGSSTAIVKQLFEELGVKYQIMNENADPYFGGSVPAPYAYRMRDQARQVVKGKFNFGFALDGDGDRVAFIDSNGKFYDCNYLMAIFYYYFIEIKKRKGTMVKNFPSSNLVAKLCKKYGYQILETRPGFKFLGPVLERDEVLLAGENAGIAFKEVSLCKDGIFAAFALIDVMVNTKKSIGMIIEELIDLTNFPTSYLEFAYVFEERQRLIIEKLLANRTYPEFALEIVKTDNYPDGYKITFTDDYWVAARMSGNENVVRFYTEMPTELEANTAIKKLENFYNLTERQE